MYLDKEDQARIAKAMMYASILAHSTAEDIQENHPERAEQLKGINEICGDLFNFFNPKEGIQIEVEVGDDEDETHH